LLHREDSEDVNPSNNADRGKSVLRAQAKRRRQAVFAAFGARAALRLRALFLEHVPVPKAALIAGYWPVGSEIDPRPLLYSLQRRGARLALPAVIGQDRPLVFRPFALEKQAPGYKKPQGQALGVPQPDAGKTDGVPDVILVPLLAFDKRGWRLGYGKGFYDRTLGRLRRKTGRKKPLLAVGLAFAAQEFERLPHNAGDARLDWIVTEQAARRFRPGRIGRGRS
jgi:5-formyltetrahydrofolate cyclo-ligase